MKKTKSKKKPQIVLVKYHSNYSDEFDVSGFALFTQDAWAEHLRLAKKFFEARVEEAREQGCEFQGEEVYFGTNEAMIYEDFEIYKSSFQVKKLNATEEKVIRATFNIRKTETSAMNTKHGTAWGLFPALDSHYFEGRI